MNEQWEEKEHRRNLIIQEAVKVADGIILDGSDGSMEETNYLTAEVAKKMMEKALFPFQGDISRKDIFSSNPSTSLSEG